MRPVACALALWAALAGAQTARVVLKWRAVPGAKSYQVEVAKDADFKQVVARQTVSEPSFTWDELPQSNHHWRVRTVDAEGREGEWSSAHTVRAAVEAPAPLEPAAEATALCGQAVTFRFQPSPLFKEWLVELSADARFATVSQVARAPGPEVPAALTTGTFWWRARAVDLRGRVSEPTEARRLSVKLDRPRLAAVADAALGDASTSLAFGEVPCAQGYAVEASVDGAAAVRFDVPHGPFGFRPNGLGEVRWRAAAVDTAGQQGDWSAEGTFRVRLPAPVPRAESPGQAEVDLAWSPVAQARGYLVTLTPESGAPKTLSTTGTTLRAPIGPGRTSWKVAAKDEKGRPGLSSEARRFTARAPARAEVTVLSPSPGEEVRGGLVVRLDGKPGEVALDAEGFVPVPGGELRVDGLSAGPHTLRARAVGTTEEVTVAFTLSPRLVAQAELSVAPEALSCDGESEAAVVVRLLDARGEVVDGPAHLAARYGVVSALHPGPAGTWVGSYRAPPAVPAGDEVLSVCLDEACAAPLARKPIALSFPRPRFSLKAAAGGRFNGGAVASALGQLSLGATRLPGASWLQLELRLGLFGARAAVPVGGETLSASAVLVPLSLAAGAGLELGRVRLRGLLGVGTVVGSLTFNGATETGTSPALELLATAALPLGPGALELELGYLGAGITTAHTTLQAGGMGLTLGYRLSLGGPP